MIMRIDKYLKTARILKRREAAKELCLMERVWLNDRKAKPGSEVKENDIIKLEFGNRILTIQVKELAKQANKAQAALMFEVLKEERKSDESPAG